MRAKDPLHVRSLLCERHMLDHPAANLLTDVGFDVGSYHWLQQPIPLVLRRLFHADDYTSGMERCATLS